MTDPTHHLRGRQYGALTPRPSDALPPHVPGRAEVYFNGHTEGAGLWKWRHYFDVYERHFAKFVGTDLHLLEIGIFSGGSIGLWQDYFGAGLQFHGIDIEPDCRAYAAPGVDVRIGDQADPGFWAQLLPTLPQLDIVIDDGGHLAHQQIATLEATLPALKPGGVYLCEDIHGSDNTFLDYVDGLSRNLHSWGTGDQDFARIPIGFQGLVGSVHQYPFVTVIERRATALDVLEAPQMGTRWQPFYEADWVPAEGAD